MQLLHIAISAMWRDKHKERFEMILEPLQAMIQLGMLSYCPIGSKLSIVNNILTIQIKSWDQGVKRSYHADAKDDLIYLFAVIRRFNAFYVQNPNLTTYSDLFIEIQDKAKAGLENLIQTYSRCDSGHLTQTLRMYISMIESDNFDIDSGNDSDYHIDDVFSKISSLYKAEHYGIIRNVLKAVSSMPDQYSDYERGFRYIMRPVNSQICKWISDNIVF